MRKKILLIFPNPISEMPTGFAYLSAVLKNKGFDVKAVVNTFNNFLRWDDFVNAVKEYNPDIVGFNIGTFRLLGVYETLQRIKKMGPFIIAGGTHATTCPDEILDRGVDIVVRNEGEVTLSELCDLWNGQSTLSLESIKGISYRRPDGIIAHNPPREYIPNLDGLPDPDFSCFDQDCFRTSDGLLKGLHRIYCSRGCPACCSFCDRAIFGQKVRYRSVENVVKEIKRRRETYNIQCFVMADDTFTFNKKYVHSFCETLKRERLNIKWSASTRANAVDLETLQIMKDTGCYMVTYGIESADPETLRLTHKGITLEQAHKAVDDAASLKFRIYVNLMTGFPWENEQGVINNIKYITRHFNQVYMYQVSGAIVPFPGTEIYRTYKDKYGFKEWWLKKEYQNFGIQIHQNVENPYKYSTYYQRQLYDDTYIWEEKFFTYTRKYKKYVKDMVFLIGKRSLQSLYLSTLKRWAVYNLCKLSRFIYELSPCLEKAVVSRITGIFNIRSHFHDRGPFGYLSRKIRNAYNEAMASIEIDNT